MNTYNLKSIPEDDLQGFLRWAHATARYLEKYEFDVHGDSYLPANTDEEYKLFEAHYQITEKLTNLQINKALT